MKNSIKFLIVSLLMVGAGSVSAATVSWDLNTSGEYSVSNSTNLEIVGGVGKLNLSIVPEIIGNYASSANPEKITLSSDGNTAYISDGNASLVIVDVTNKVNPALIGTYNFGTFVRYATLSSDGNTLYIANDFRLEILDISDPVNPVVIGDYNTFQDDLNNIIISSDENTAFLGKANGLEIVDITNPAAPVLIGTYSSAGILGMALSNDENTLYLTANQSGRNPVFKVEIIDVSVPATPTPLGEFSTQYFTHQIELSDDESQLHLVNVTDGFLILDISVPSNITSVGSYVLDDLDPRAFAISSDEDTAYVSGLEYFSFLDISDPSNPALLNEYNIISSSDDIKLSPLEDYAYIVDNNGLNIISTEEEYSSSYLTSTSSFIFSGALEGFSHTPGANNEGTITYQLSTDDGATWYYWDGGLWTETSATDGTETSSATDINTNIATLDTDGGDLLFRAYLNSDGTQQVELDAVNVDGNFTAFTITMTDPATSTTIPNKAWFPITFSVECTQGDCGDIDLTLDPIGTFYFEKTDYGSEEDCITDNVCITRGDNKGIYNSVLEEVYDNNDYTSPLDTEWTENECGNDPTIHTYQNWADAAGGGYSPHLQVDVPMCVHLITDDIYIDIEFQSWTSGANGGGFSYYRSTAGKGIIPTTETQPFYTDSATNPVTLTVGEGQTVDYTFNVYADGTIGDEFDFFGFGAYASGGATYVESETYTITIGEEEQEIIPTTSTKSSTKKSSRRLTQAQVNAIFGTIETSNTSNEIRELQLKLISLITQLLAMMRG